MNGLLDGHLFTSHQIYENIDALVEADRKLITKSIEMAYENELKEIREVNAKLRMSELNGITKRNAPLEYKRLSDKYVKCVCLLNNKIFNKTSPLDPLICI